MPGDYGGLRFCGDHPYDIRMTSHWYLVVGQNQGTLNEWIAILQNIAGSWMVNERLMDGEFPQIWEHHDHHKFFEKPLLDDDADSWHICFKGAVGSGSTPPGSDQLSWVSSRWWWTNMVTYSSYGKTWNNIIWLVVEPTPLKNMKVSWDYYSQYMEK